MSSIPSKVMPHAFAPAEEPTSPSARLSPILRVILAPAFVGLGLMAMAWSRSRARSTRRT